MILCENIYVNNGFPVLFIWLNKVFYKDRGFLQTNKSLTHFFFIIFDQKIKLQRIIKNHTELEKKCNCYKITRQKHQKIKL